MGNLSSEMHGAAQVQHLVELFTGLSPASSWQLSSHMLQMSGASEERDASAP